MVFDVDKLKEDIDLLTGSLDAPRLTPSQILVVGSLLKMGRLVVAGQPLSWCEEHQVSAHNDDECWQQVWGQDDDYTLTRCRMVEWWRTPTGTNE